MRGLLFKICLKRKIKKYCKQNNVKFINGDISHGLFSSSLVFIADSWTLITNHKDVKMVSYPNEPYNPIYFYPHEYKEMVDRIVAEKITYELSK